MANLFFEVAGQRTSLDVVSRDPSRACLILDSLTPDDEDLLKSICDIRNIVNQGRLVLESLRFDEEDGWRPGPILKRQVAEAKDENSCSIWRTLYVLGGSIKSAIIFGLICGSHKNRKSKPSLAEQINLWQAEPKEILAMMLERLDVHSEISIWITRQPKPPQKPRKHEQGLIVDWSNKVKRVLTSCQKRFTRFAHLSNRGRNPIRQRGLW